MPPPLAAGRLCMHASKLGHLCSVGEKGLRGVQGTDEVGRDAVQVAFARRLPQVRWRVL